jgi:predicted transcriptional regulator
MTNPSLLNPVRSTIYMPDKLVKGLKLLAKRRSQTYSEIVRIAAREYLTRELTMEKEKWSKLYDANLESPAQGGNPAQGED